MATINRALAVAEMEGASAALEAIDAAAADARLADYQAYWAARAELRPGRALATRLGRLTANVDG